MERKRKWTLKLYKPNISYFVQQHNTDLPDCKNEKKKCYLSVCFHETKVQNKQCAVPEYTYTPPPPNRREWNFLGVEVSKTKNFEEMREAW